MDIAYEVLRVLSALSGGLVLGILVNLLTEWVLYRFFWPRVAVNSPSRYITDYDEGPVWLVRLEPDNGGGIRCLNCRFLYEMIWHGQRRGTSPTLTFRTFESLQVHLFKHYTEGDKIPSHLFDRGTYSSDDFPDEKDYE